MRVHPDVRRYLVQVSRATRSDPDVRLGASPRATLALFRTAQAWAAVHGRDFVTPDDVTRLAVPVLAHRLVVALEARLRGKDAAAIVERILESTPVPLEPGENAPGLAPPAWLAWLVVLAMVLLATLAAALVVRLLLASRFVHWPRPAAESPASISVEPAGNANRDARLLVGWLLRWLRRWLARPPRPRSAGAEHLRGGADALNAWAAYRVLLEWAERHGARRRPAETTQQFGSRLVRQAPDAAETIELVTRTFEWERYGDIPPSLDHLRRLERAVRNLPESSSPRRATI